MKKLIITLIIGMFLIVLVNAQTYQDCSIYGTCKTKTTTSSSTTTTTTNLTNFWTTNSSQSGLIGFKSGNFTLGDNSNVLSISPTDRTLYGETGLAIATWCRASGTVYGICDNTKGISLDVNHRMLWDSAVSQSIDYDNRILYDSSGNSILDWHNYKTALFGDSKIITNGNGNSVTIGADSGTGIEISTDTIDYFGANGFSAYDDEGNSVGMTNGITAFQVTGNSSFKGNINITGNITGKNNICLSNGTNCAISSNLTNIALTNQSNTYSINLLQNFSNGNLTGINKLCNSSNICFDLTTLNASSSINLTNIALTNQSNNFTGNQNITGNLFVKGNLAVGKLNFGDTMDVQAVSGATNIVSNYNDNSYSAFGTYGSSAYLIMFSATSTAGLGNEFGMSRNGANQLISSRGKLGFGTDDNYLMTLGTNALPALTIDTSQNVGIGTITPNSKLQVNGTLNITGTITTVNASTYTNKVVCYLAGGTLGHCTSIVGVDGSCTCVSN